MDIVYSPECLDFGDEDHPDSSERIEEAVGFLRDRSYNFVEPDKCDEEDLLLVHSKEHIQRIKNGNFHNPDNPRFDNIYDYARLSVGASIKASEINGFSLMRPPGHHAGENYVDGFCYFNNIAVAVEESDKDTLIVDIDRHHGNGTQDIFEGSDSVEYVSLHGAGYPGTGRRSYKNYHNHRFSKDISDDEYLEKLDEMLDIDREFDLVAVSAGFDGHNEDPLSDNLNLSSDGYRRIGERLGEFGLPVFCSLEGGYNDEKLGRNIHSFIQGLED